MQLIVRQSCGLSGEVSPPGDKSISHRAILLSAMAAGCSRIRRFLNSGVTHVMLEVINHLGVSWKIAGDELVIESPGLHAFTRPAARLDCGNSATTLRLLAGVLAAAGVPAVLDGSPGLRRRPMKRIIEPLQQMGVDIQASEEGTAPLSLSGRAAGKRLNGLSYVSPVASAQVKSCILLAGLASGAPIHYTEPVLSRDHSERMFTALGIDIQTTRSSSASTAVMQPGGLSFLHPLDLRIPGDFSAAAFILVAAVITPGSDVTIRDVGLNPTRLGLLLTLQEMGAAIEVENVREECCEPVGDIRVRASRLHGATVNAGRVVEMIDEFPVFAVAAACAGGITEVSDAEELRHKESDRIGMLCRELKKQGVAVAETPDGFRIRGNGAITGGETVDPHGDHRLAMGLAVLGLRAERPICIKNAEIINESYPEFPTVLKGLGADLNVLDGEEDSNAE